MASARGEPRTTFEFEQANAEHELIVRSPVALAAARAQDPEFRTARGQLLSDAVMAQAAMLRKTHGTAHAERYLSEQALAQGMRVLASSEAVLRAQRGASSPSSALGNPHRMSRVNAMLHTALKSGLPTLLALGALACVVPGPVLASFAMFAAGIVALRVLGAALTRTVF